MTFGTSIHCIDGRIQEPVRKYLKKHYGLSYVDSITEPGPSKIISENKNSSVIKSILIKINISIKRHKSRLIAISSHHDCAANSLDEEAKKGQTRAAVDYLKEIYPEVEIVGLWIDDKWQVASL